MSTDSKLFSSFQVGDVSLSNRIVMAPLTRSRAIGNIPNALMADYYQQRADAGLLITEGTAPSADGTGYARIPGLWSDEHIAGWKLVTDAVHAAGGKIFVQIMHTGRVGATENLPEGGSVKGPSPIAAPGQMYTDSNGMVPHPVPAEMDAEDIRKAIAEYVTAASNAISAGFDGVELHGANGYLIDQFLNTASNQRSDNYGGSVDNRIRFAVEVAKAVSDAIGAGKTGIRISPYGGFGGMVPDADMHPLYASLATALGEIGLAYIHLVDHSSMGMPAVPMEVTADIQNNFAGAIILSGGYDRERAEADLDAGKGELVAFGRPFIGNPDLVSRMKSGAELAEADQATFYTPGPEGYTDYPVLAKV